MIVSFIRICLALLIFAVGVFASLCVFAIIPMFFLLLPIAIILVLLGA